MPMNGGTAEFIEHTRMLCLLLASAISGDMLMGILSLRDSGHVNVDSVQAFKYSVVVAVTSSRSKS